MHSGFEPIRSTTSKVVGKRLDSEVSATLFAVTVEFAARARYVTLDQQHNMEASSEDLGQALIAEIKAGVAVYYVFDGEGEMEDDFVTEFSRSEAARGAWSFWRQWFSTQATALHLPQASLPRPNAPAAPSLASIIARKLGALPK